MIVMTGAWAQPHPAIIETDYQNVDETVYQTAGKDFRLYVAPDPVFSPDYDGDGTPPYNTLSNWRWVTGADYATGTLLKDWSNENYVEIANPSVGSTTYWVSERFNALCNDPIGKSKIVTVIAAPTAQIATADPASRCGNQVADAVVINITENVPDTWAKYAFTVTEKVENWDDINGTNPVELSSNATFVDNPTTTLVDPTGGAQPNYTYTFNTSVLTVENNLPTVYTYTLANPSDVAAGSGMASAISLKSDYLGGSTVLHSFGTKTTYVAVVVPTPTTGPIYHIPNNYAF